MSGKKKEKKINLHEITPEEQLKYEIAEELGLLPRVLEGGWKSLSSKETGKIGGMVNQRKKRLSESLQQKNT
ncbi:MAG: alpha/beta-type small acid-soluble spore protein [Lachnospiraceae bacterium]|nr:alpha/beta-type small acid-soluble spore protein [Lachnospiraceae bacterium]